MKLQKDVSEKKESPYLVASVDRAMELLIILEEAPQDMGVTELSKVLGVQKSTVHNLLQTLLVRDFIRQTDSGRYTLGFRLMRLGQSAADRLDIRRLALPLLRELAAEANEYVLFAVINRDELTIVENVPPPRPTFLVPKFDYCHTFHSSSLGKVFLAFGPEEQQAQILAGKFTRYTPYTMVEKERLLEEITKIQEQGYAIACNETIEGVTCIGAPVFNAHGKLEAAVSVSSSSAWLTNAKYNAMAAILLKKARALSRLLGY
ncbi:MAG TPA: IclR family transcriptional regulator [Patescibacteria group bacterium]|nr:IclR family transcriptional regulator [Patescibacteria group bacterium]